ncbi:RND transporter [Halopseudomonas laoshanensis]|uniref:RND transporter n=2 Tax=Halopseudomonas TaxID=2901189 RepID=A0A7V7KY07_9GAMM|nr:MULTISPECIES: copper-binding protein [Halopseudomonas]MBQ0741881.1 copper-binding protein [Pseudomonas sp.]WOD11799.1 copper-binding protein [Pseudomonas sp. NyZ704]KAA0695284.1 RND transporter [Halopseudomonas laoshanensis]PCC98750.1 RND transporter [Halopseudomonas pelagia]QFY58411.1 RND transporter [Halopseudomonas pelagia]
MKKVMMFFVACALTATSAMADEHDAMTEGELRKIDQAGQRVTLRHGPIDNLKMPPMTMVFRVENAAELEGLTAGDKVRFRADKEGGNYIVTELEKAE